MASNRRLGCLSKQLSPAPGSGATNGPPATVTPTYKAAVIGLGWMGMLYDLAQRVTEVTQEMIDVSS